MPIYETIRNNETEFQHGFGDDDGNGRQQRTIDADTKQCNRVNMVKNEALTNNKWTENIDNTRHVQGGDGAEGSAKICNDLRRTPVTDQEYSHRHGTNANALQSLHTQIRTNHAWCRHWRSHSQSAPTDESQQCTQVRTQVGARAETCCGGSCQSTTKEAR